MKINTKLLLAFLLIGLIPLVTISIVFHINAKDSLTREVLSHLESVAEIQRNRVESIVEQNLERLNLVSSRTQLRISLDSFVRNPNTEDQDKINKILLDARSSVSSFRYISILTLDGKVIASTDAAKIGSTHLNDEVLIKGQKENTADIFFFDENQSLCVCLSGPLYLEDKLLGVVVIDSAADSILSSIGDYTGLGTTGETLLAGRDEKGDAIFITPTRFDESAALRRTVPKEGVDSPTIQALLKNEELFTDTVDYRGEPVLAATEYISKTGWGLVTKIDKAEALAPVARLQNFLVTIILLSLALVLLVSLFLARTITRPITKLVHMAVKVSEGDLTQRAEVTSRDEIGILARACNQMKDSLVKNNYDLEQELAERKRAEERIYHLATVLRAVRGVNQLITREKDRKSLIQKSCDLLVERRSYEKSWILLLDEEGTPESVAHAGLGEDASMFLEQIMKGGYPECLKDLLSQEKQFLAYDQPGKQHEGCVLSDTHSSRGVFRCKLEYDGKLYGALGVTISSWAVSDKEEQDLFLELCGDISYALAGIEREEERQRAEERLRESEANLEEAQRIAHLGNWVWDIQNNTIDWSNEVYRIFGFDPDEFSPTYETFLDRVHPDDREYVQASLLDSSYEKKSYNIEHRILRPDGSIRMVREIGEVLLDEEGEPVKMFGTVHDITDLREAEAKALEAEALRELERLRSGFMASVSHELRTPLASIKGFVSTLLRTDTKWSEEEQRDFLQTIDHESDRLTRLINDLLDISRIKAGALKLKKANYRITEILDSIGPRLAKLTEHHRLKTAVPPDLPPVFVDEMRIGQILTNLVENATKYSSEGGEITVEARLEGDQVIVIVTDRGEGIAAKLIDKIFDRFYQAESIVTGRKSGTGLGLTICRGILKAHGGKIWVESKLGEGSEFSFSLPVGKGEEQDAEGSGD